MASPSADDVDGEGLDLPTRFLKGRPGERAGIDVEQLGGMPKSTVEVPVTVIDYGPDKFEVREVRDFETFIESRRPDWVTVRWINVDGLSDPVVVRALPIKDGLHPLSIEDVMVPNQRPKLEPYTAEGGRPPHLFLIVRMVQRLEEKLVSEQI